MTLLQSKAAKDDDSRPKPQRRLRDALRAHIDGMRAGGRAPEDDEDAIFFKDKSTTAKAVLRYQSSGEAEQFQNSAEYSGLPGIPTIQGVSRGADTDNSSSFNQNETGKLGKNIIEVPANINSQLSRTTPGRMQDSNLNQYSNVYIAYIYQLLNII